MFPNPQMILEPNIKLKSTLYRTCHIRVLALLPPGTLSRLGGALRAPLRPRRKTYQTQLMCFGRSTLCV